MLTIALTWPLALSLTHDLPGDLGDPLLTVWIIAWDAEHMLRALGGDLHALAGYWHANIFHPHPLTLAYSEHLTPQALQILPVYALTRNPILSHNLVFLSTFVLSGLGMFLFVREITGRRDVGFLAGLAFAFAPYRFGAIPHIQVLSSEWMPFALLGFRRFFDTRRNAPLAAGSVAWLAQNLSCGYYLFYFSPILALYVAWELTVRKLWRDAWTMTRVAGAAACVVAATVPFLLPYLEVRKLGITSRTLEETDLFSANVYAYLTSDPKLRIWGDIATAWRKAEGYLFPGLTVVVLSAIAIYDSARPIRPSSETTDDGRGNRALVESTVRKLILFAAVILVAMLFGWTLHLPVGPLMIKITDLGRAAVIVVGLSIALLAWSRHARQGLVRWMSSPVGLMTILTAFAVTMSFGPHIHSRHKVIIEDSIYTVFYNFVPGFDGLRVPARFGMIVALGLSVLGAFGAQSLARRAGRLTIGVASALIVLESIALPISLNLNPTDYRYSGLAPLPGVLAFGADLPPVYRFVSGLPAGSALIELPAGEVAFDVRYMFSSTSHWRPLVNGFSGTGPADYGLLAALLNDALTTPDRAWAALSQSSATHAIVHEAYYEGTRGRDISNWLRSRGASELTAFGGDRVFSLRNPPNPLH